MTSNQDKNEQYFRDDLTKKSPRFNWNRFYDELESADPQKFPFWMWFTRETISLVGTLISSAIIGVLMFVWAVIFVGIFTSNIAKYHPDWTLKQFKEAVCQN